MTRKLDTLDGITWCCLAGILSCILCLATGCGSADTAEKILNMTDASRATIAADRNQLLADLLHDKSVLATNAAVEKSRLALTIAAKNGVVDLATVNKELTEINTEANLVAATRALNRDQVEMLNVAEERANALELGLRIQIESAKGIFGRVMEAITTYERAQKTPPNSAPLIVPPFVTTQPEK
jgi:hypothetical protein